MTLMNLLSTWWPASAEVLMTLSGIEFTIGGLALIGIMAPLALLSRKPMGRLAIRIARKRGLDDERLLAFIGDLTGVIVVLVMMGAALDLGQVITFRQFTDAIFRLLNFSLFQIANTPISLIHYLVLMLGLGVGLQTAGVNLSALFAAGAVFAVGIGFAMQNIAQNFVSGVIVLAEQVIRPGDILEVDGHVVRVEEMGIRSTVVRTLNEEFLILPNSHLAQNTVKNFSLKKGTLRIRVTVGVAYESDMKQVEAVLLAAAETIGDQADSPSPRVLLDAFGDSSVNYEVSIWIKTPWDLRTRASELRQAIWWHFKAANITISFPQLDVHLGAPTGEALRLIKPEQ